MTGITKITDLKYIIIHLFIQFCTNYMITNLTNQMTQHNIIHPFPLCLLYLLHISTHLTTYLLEPKKDDERLQINNRITQQCDDKMRHAPHSWHNKHTQTAQETAIRDIFNAYNNMTFVITDLITQTMRSLAFTVVICNTNLLFGITIMGSTILLLQIRKFLNQKLEIMDKQMGDLSKQMELQTSIKFVNRIDTHYNKSFSSIFSPSDHNVTEGLHNHHKIWAQRDNLARRSQFVISAISNLVIMLSLLHMVKYSKPGVIMFILLDSDRVFGFVNVISRLDEFKNYSGGKLDYVFEMLDDIRNCESVNPTRVWVHNTIIHANPTRVQAYGLRKQITPEIMLYYGGDIQLDLSGKKGLILLNGPKGCGKSTTLDLVSGFYDGSVTTSTYTDDVHCPDEFRALQESRTYIRQKVANQYTRNRLNTVVMSLSQLFPSGNQNEIENFLIPFGLAHKLPSPLSLDAPVSNDEKGLSGGQVAALVLASYLWKAIQSESRLFLLDEPTDGIDFESVCDIFNAIITQYNGLIMLVTHDETLKRWLHLRGSITQVWQYKNSANELTFEILNPPLAKN